MAFALPNTRTENGNSNEGFANYNYILKDEVKADWYMYRVLDKSVFRPYPVYDSNGIPCPSVGIDDPENPYSIFSEAFALVPLAVFAGLDGKLQFIDYCTDMDAYAAPGEVLTRTPYEFMIAKLREMLPLKDSNSTKSGLPSPSRLLQVQKNISFSSTALMFRGVMVRSKGKPSSSKRAVEGMMFKSVCYVMIKSAITSMMTELKKPRDPRQPWSPQNSAADGLFEFDGLTIQFDKTGTAASDPYQVSFGYEPNYAKAAMQFFSLPTADPMQYHNAVRNMFGPNQSIGEILRLLSVGEMVAILKEKYPISWVYYGLKDSPYATLLTPDDREAALQDPEMAVWFGMPAATPQQHLTTPAQTSNQQAGYPAPTAGYPQAAPQQSTYPGANSQPGFQPPPTYQTGVPMGPAATAPAPGAGNAAMERMKFWQNKYSNTANTTDADGLKY